MRNSLTKQDLQMVYDYEEANHLLIRSVKKEHHHLTAEQGKLYVYTTQGKQAGWHAYPVSRTLQEERFYTSLYSAKLCQNHNPPYYNPEISDDFRSERVKTEDSGAKAPGKTEKKHV